MATTKKRIDLSLREKVHILQALERPGYVNALKLIRGYVQSFQIQDAYQPFQQLETSIIKRL